MINVVNPICLERDCKVQATFGVEECKKMFCSRHRKEGMCHISAFKKRHTQKTSAENGIETVVGTDNKDFESVITNEIKDVEIVSTEATPLPNTP